MEGAKAPHARARDYLDGIDDRQRWDNALRFAVVRDPYARLVSCWAYAFGMGAPSVARFREWVASGCQLHERYFLDMGDGRRVWMHSPQAEWIESVAGEIVVSTLLRLERIDSQWPHIAAQIGADSVLTHANTSDHYAVDDYYDDRTRGLVRARYLRDFELEDANWYGLT